MRGGEEIVLEVVSEEGEIGQWMVRGETEEWEERRHDSEGETRRREERRATLWVHSLQLIPREDTGCEQMAQERGLVILDTKMEEVVLGPLGHLMESKSTIGLLCELDDDLDLPVLGGEMQRLIAGRVIFVEKSEWITLLEEMETQLHITHLTSEVEESVARVSGDGGVAMKRFSLETIEDHTEGFVFAPQQELWGDYDRRTEMRSKQGERERQRGAGRGREGGAEIQTWFGWL
jgi:hypothetical protein